VAPQATIGGILAQKAVEERRNLARNNLTLEAASLLVASTAWPPEKRPLLSHELHPCSIALASQCAALSVSTRMVYNRRDTRQEDSGGKRVD